MIRPCCVARIIGRPAKKCCYLLYQKPFAALLSFHHLVSRAASKMDPGSYFILKSGINVLLGIVWLVYLGSLDKKANTPEEAETLCRDVNPLIRTLLYILAWVILISCLFSFGAILYKNDVADKGRILSFIAIAAVIYIIQLRYLHEITTSARSVGEDCTKLARGKRIFLYVFAILMIVGGSIQIAHYVGNPSGTLLATQLRLGKVMGVDKMGVDQMGMDQMGSRASRGRSGRSRSSGRATRTSRRATRTSRRQ